MKPQNLWKKAGLLLLGSVLFALSFDLFLTPAKIAPGGISGLATAPACVTPLRISLWTLLLNVPLLLFAWKSLGR